MIGANKPKGWQYQIEKQATIELAYEIDYLLFRNSVPLNGEAEFNTFNHNTFGNFRSEANVGFSVRWGKSLAHTFGRLSSQLGHVGNLISETEPQSLVFFTRFQAGYRFNDLTFDGTLPYQSEVEFKPNRVRSLTGFCYYFSGAAITWSFNFYSMEYHEDKASWHGYGLLQFSGLM